MTPDLTKPLQRVRLPPEAQVLVKKYDLQRLVASKVKAAKKKYDFSARSKLIPQVRSIIASSIDSEELSDDPETIVECLWVHLQRDQQFVHYVVHDRPPPPESKDAWTALFVAYAWVLLQRYNKELGGTDD